MWLPETHPLPGPVAGCLQHILGMGEGAWLQAPRLLRSGTPAAVSFFLGRKRPSPAPLVPLHHLALSMCNAGRGGALCSPRTRLPGEMRASLFVIVVPHFESEFESYLRHRARARKWRRPALRTAPCERMSGIRRSSGCLFLFLGRPLEPNVLVWLASALLLSPEVRTFSLTVPAMPSDSLAFAHLS